MLWKDIQNKKDWDNLLDSPCPFHQKLRQYVYLLDLLSLMLGFGELTITSFIRLDNTKSLHYYARALDIRVKDKSAYFYWGMSMIGQAIFAMNKQFRMNCHMELYNKIHQHIHIEIREK